MLGLDKLGLFRTPESEVWWSSEMMIQKDFLSKQGGEKTGFKPSNPKDLVKSISILVHLKDIKPHLLVNG